MDLTAAIEAKRNKQKKPELVEVGQPIEEEIEMTPQNLEDLEKQLDEALEEFKKEEILIEELEQEEMQVSNNQLYKTMLDINETLIIGKREELIITNKVFRAIEKNIAITEKVNEKYNKTTIAIIVTFFVLGMLIGMQDDKWLPYVGNILDFARTATNVVK